MKKRSTSVWDVVVIGGGPAGMMAAGRAAERGRSVLLLEKNASLGKKLLITGGGRCNVTNNKELRIMLAKYKGKDKFLFSAFSQFSIEDALSFFHERGMATKEEAEGRIFPVSNSAQSVWNVLVQYMKKGGVHTETASTVSAVETRGGQFVITLKDKREIQAKTCVVATGGISRPETGSTGDGYAWLEKMGHRVVENDFALVPVALKESWVKKLAGVSLQGVKLTTFQNGQKQEATKGSLLFTHVGISGPTVLNMSRGIGELLKYGEVVIALDLFPKVDGGELKQLLQTLLITESNKKIKNVLGKLVPNALVPVLLSLADIDSETPNHSVRSESRKALVTVMKAVPLRVKGLLGKDKAVISSGGIPLEEIDFKSMASRLVPGLYLVGDILDIDRPSGGYSLQLCWTTGFVAGSNC